MGTPNQLREKICWKTVKLPDTVIQRIKRVIVFTGHPSVAEYVREKVNHSLTLDLMEVEKFEERQKDYEEEKEERRHLTSY